MNKSIFREKKVSGISAVPLIIALVLLISLGAFFISLMLGKHIGAPLLAQSTKALYIADAGIEYTAVFLRDNHADDANWTAAVPNDIPGVPPNNTISFGGGTFAVAFTNKTPNSVIATSTGTISNSVRVVSAKFTRFGVLMSNPVNWLARIRLTNDVTVNGSICSPPNCNATPPDNCPCTTGVTLTPPPPPTLPDNAPSLPWPEVRLPNDPPPPGVTLSDGIYTFNAGTYYFDELRIRNGAVVTVNGPVTIWISDRFRLEGTNTQFNGGGDAANLLLLSAGASADPAEPEFEIRDAPFRGAIYGPQPGVEVEIRDTQIVGAITGDDVRLRDTTITFDPNAGLNAMIKASGWGEM